MARSKIIPIEEIGALIADVGLESGDQSKPSIRRKISTRFRFRLPRLYSLIQASVAGSYTAARALAVEVVASRPPVSHNLPAPHAAALDGLGAHGAGAGPGGA